MYTFVVCRDGKDVARFSSVDEAFAWKETRGVDRKQQGDVVFVELRSTGYRARVLRPG